MKTVPHPDRSRKMDAAVETARQALTAALALLDAIQETAPERHDSQEWIDPVSVSGLPKRMVFDACRSGALDARKVRRKWRCKRAALDAWIESQGVQTRPVNDGATRVLQRWAARRAAGGGR